MADDDESLDEILSTPARAEPAAPVETEATPEEPVRDEHGRFAPKAESEPEAETGTEDPDAETHAEKKAPPGLLEERRKRQAIEQERDTFARELAELRGTVNALMQRGNQPAQPQPEKPKPPEFWTDPQGFNQHLVTEALSPVQERLAIATFRASRAEAIAEHGKETVTTAQAAIKEAIRLGELNGEAVKAALVKSDDPIGDIVRWHQGSPAVQTATLRDQLRAELMAEFGIDPNNRPAPTTVTPSTRNPVVRLPPSLSRVPAGHAAPERDESLDEVLSGPRRRAS
jgi:hypothetical protein